LFEYLEAGETLDEFLRQFPSASTQHAVAVLRPAKKRTEEAAIRP
jgi:uncharacterized protein (DUF433 family)